LSEGLLPEFIWPKKSEKGDHQSSVTKLDAKVHDIERRVAYVEANGVNQKSEIFLEKREEQWSRSMKLKVSVHGYKFDLDISEVSR
jgi:hypothetical protein